jgi:hypothetical protein
MRMRRSASVIFGVVFAIRTVVGQVPEVKPRVLTKPAIDGSIAVVEVSAHFVTAIRMPEPVNSVVVGDPALFQVEHSDREPNLVFVKALTTKPAETNLLISTSRGHESSLLLVSRGEQKSATPPSVDFLLKYKSAVGFLIEPDRPSALVSQTVPLGPKMQPATASDTSAAAATPVSFDKLGAPTSPTVDPPNDVRSNGLDGLLTRQEHAPLPRLYGEHFTGETVTGDQVLAGVSEVVDGGDHVIVLFSAVNPTDHPILLMPPQVQLAGKIRSGKIMRRSRWASANQLPVMDFRLSKRRLGPSERADGVVLFERPPYKLSNETLFLQMAQAGAVDCPALAPIGFGISTLREESSYGTGKSTTGE